MTPIKSKNITNDDEIISPCQSQLLGPKTAETSATLKSGLKNMVLLCLCSSSSGMVVSLVMKASICIRSWEASGDVPESGKRRSSMESSRDVLKAHTRRSLGIFSLAMLALWRSSLVIEMNGVMPLPPLIMTSMSCLQLCPTLKFFHTETIIEEVSVRIRHPCHSDCGKIADSVILRTSEGRLEEDLKGLQGRPGASRQVCWRRVSDTAIWTSSLHS